MLNLDAKSNDTSLALDAIRAAAAQAVCIGHAINFSYGQAITLAPQCGVLVFFVLSGFVIAYTLDTKSTDPAYDLTAFGIDRFARIYAVYVPALALILAADWWLIGAPDMRAFVGNLLMLQGVPGSGITTFGTAGHLTSIAVEFHIYFFVGATLFFLQGKQRVLSAAVIAIFTTMPLGYFLAMPGSDRALFVLWLAGFGCYYAIRAADLRGMTPALLLLPLAVLYFGYSFASKNPYDLANYPLLIVLFATVVIITQNTQRLHFADRVIRFFAGYSLSLFLVHLTVIVHLYQALGTSWPMVAIAMVLANIVSIALAAITERHYRRFAEWLKIRAEPAACPHCGQKHHQARAGDW